ncbi:aminotransferase class I/II-fold pyridoxal phosphate-dependent enzyme [Halochromatium glycolicum]|uniref:aminotransferase class I/II-fold pyridoxal phosphate-dependent enzyme n=1 Tax=Halochromatium glycolicum TaxID=85075 RepID=UPI0030B86207
MAKHLILDVNSVVDLWLNTGSAASTEALFAAEQSGRAALWVAATSLATLDSVARQAFKRRGLKPEDAAAVVSRLMTLLLQRVSVLTAHGFEQAELYARARDFEDAQIAAAARSLGGQAACIVTEDRRFDAVDEVTCKTPAQALQWLQQEERSPAERGAAIPFIDLATQQALLRPQLERNLESVLRHGQYILGPEVRELEERLATYTGARHCVTAASGTDALLISLMALGIGPGDEVITTPFTFVATVEVIVLVGATPVFVDIEPDTCNLDVRLLEAKITDNTKAIMPVSLYGQPAEMDAINAVAARHGNIPVIEDAAQSFGAEYKGRKSGALSMIGCTSFFPSKPLGGYGDGGAIFTSDDAIAQACREIRVHGQSARYVHGRVGIGGRMDSLQCAVVLANLERFDQDIAQRQAVAWRYHQLLSSETGPSRSRAAAAQQRVGTQTSSVDDGSRPQSPNGRQGSRPEAGPLASRQGSPSNAVLTGDPLAPFDRAYRLLPWPGEDRTSVFAQYSLLVEDRDAMQARLKAEGIPTAVHYPMPMNQQPAYAHHCCPECTPIAAAVSAHIMSLPMHPHLGLAEQERIARALVD